MADSTDVRGWLELASEENRISVTPYLTTDKPRLLRYELEVRAQGPAGQSSSRQAGRVEAVCCEPVTLSRSSFRIDPLASYHLELRIFEGEQLLVEQSAAYP